MINDIKKKLPILFSLIIITIITFSSFNNAYAFNVNKLLEYYQFNQTIGDTIIDNCKYTSSPACLNSDLTSSGSPTCQQSGIIDYSCLYEGSLPRSVSLTIPSSANYTINTWIFKDSYHPAAPQDTGINNILTSRSQGSNANAIYLLLGDDNTVGAGIFNNAGNSVPLSTQTTTTIHDNKWTMVTLQVTHSNGYNFIKIYVNSTLYATGNTTNSIAFGQGPTVGNRAGGGGGVSDFSLKGNEDEIAIFNETLSQNRINSLYNSGYGKDLVVGNTPGDIILTPNKGPKGSIVQLNGTGFGSSSLISLFYDNVFFGNIATTDSQGFFSHSIQIPNLSLGVHTVTVKDHAIPVNQASTGFNVTKSIPTIILTPVNAKVGSSVSVSGSGFVNQSPLLFRLDSKVISTIPGLPITDNNGSFTNVSFIVPQTIAGHHNINVTDGNNNNATAILNATSNEILIPTSGIVGSTVTINGYGFSASSSININFDSKLVGSATTNTNGTFLNSKIRVPSSTVNAHMINSTEYLPSCTATGGTITSSGGMMIHKFTSNGTFTVTSGTCNALVLVVAGGGGGSQGGGGAGGLIYNSSYPVSPNSYTVTIGAGGVHDMTPSTNGRTSVFGQLTAIGGGRGIANSAGASGGSGGGGANAAGGAGTAGQGNAGGSSSSGLGSGGGGGAGAIGGTGSGTTGGNGGNGLSYSISGSSVTYAGGGAGGASVTPGTGGSGGGGNGGITGSSCTAGTTNTGGGGGGIYLSYPACDGGSGIVIISYLSSSNGKHTASSTFNTVPSLSTIPSSGKVGSTITLNGSGFSGSSQINVYFGNSLITTNPPFFITNATGSFNNIKITVPNVPLGNYNIQAVDSASYNAAHSFSVTAANSNAPDPVSDLHSTFINNTAIGLAWSQPNLHKNILSGYQINYTTPFGIPQTIITNNTLSSSTQFTITGLTPSTNYSFRVGIWTTNSSNAYGNVLDITTSAPFTPQNFTLGTVGTTQNGNINSTNPLKVPIAFQRQDFGTTTIIKIIYQNNFNLTCNMFYEFAQVNRTYNNLPSTPYDAGFVQTIFNFNNTVNDVIKINCKDIISGTEGRYVITQVNFPIKQQVDNFRNGTYGTHGQFGSYDLITLGAIILAMIGLNRLNEAVGAFFTIAFIGVFGYFHIIEWQSMLISMIALIVMLMVTQTRKD